MLHHFSPSLCAILCLGQGDVTSSHKRHEPGSTTWDLDSSQWLEKLQPSPFYIFLWLSAAVDSVHFDMSLTCTCFASFASAAKQQRSVRGVITNLPTLPMYSWHEHGLMRVSGEYQMWCRHVMSFLSSEHQCLASRWKHNTHSQSINQSINQSILDAFRLDCWLFDTSLMPRVISIARCPVADLDEARLLMRWSERNQAAACDGGVSTRCRSGAWQRVTTGSHCDPSLVGTWSNRSVTAIPTSKDGKSKSSGKDVENTKATVTYL